MSSANQTTLPAEAQTWSQAVADPATPIPPEAQLLAASKDADMDADIVKDMGEDSESELEDLPDDEDEEGEETAHQDPEQEGNGDETVPQGWVRAAGHAGWYYESKEAARWRFDKLVQHAIDERPYGGPYYKIVEQCKDEDGGTRVRNCYRQFAPGTFQAGDKTYTISELSLQESLAHQQSGNVIVGNNLLQKIDNNPNATAYKIQCHICAYTMNIFPPYRGIFDDWRRWHRTSTCSAPVLGLNKPPKEYPSEWVEIEGAEGWYYESKEAAQLEFGCVVRHEIDEQPHGGPYYTVVEDCFGANGEVVQRRCHHHFEPGLLKAGNKTYLIGILDRTTSLAVQNGGNLGTGEDPLRVFDSGPNQTAYSLSCQSCHNEMWYVPPYRGVFRDWRRWHHSYYCAAPTGGPHGRPIVTPEEPEEPEAEFEEDDSYW